MINKILYNINNMWEDLSTVIGAELEPHLSVIRDFQFIYSVMTINSFSQSEIKELNKGG